MEEEKEHIPECEDAFSSQPIRPMTKMPYYSNLFGSNNENSRSTDKKMRSQESESVNASLRDGLEDHNNYSGDEEEKRPELNVIDEEEFYDPIDLDDET
jgi:hypothetical protein